MHAFCEHSEHHQEVEPVVLFKTPLQYGGLSSAMPNRDHADLPVRFIDHKKNGVRPVTNFGSLGQTTGLGKTGEFSGNFFQIFPNNGIKSQARAWFPFFIPIDRLIPFVFRRLFDDDFKLHFLPRRRSSIAMKTSSARLPRVGWFNAASARRSSSTVSSGVSSASNSPNSVQIFSATFCCSSVGIRRISSRMSVALIPKLYSLGLAFAIPFVIA